MARVRWCVRTKSNGDHAKVRHRLSKMDPKATLSADSPVAANTFWVDTILEQQEILGCYGVKDVTQSSDQAGL